MTHIIRDYCTNTIGTIMNSDLQTVMRLSNDPQLVAHRDSLRAVARFLFDMELCGGHELSPPERHAITVDRSKLRAVKLFKERTGCSLMEAKRGIEALMEKEFGFTHFKYDNDGTCHPPEGCKSAFWD